MSRPWCGFTNTTKLPHGDEQPKTEDITLLICVIKAIIMYRLVAVVTLALSGLAAAKPLGIFNLTKRNQINAY